MFYPRAHGPFFSPANDLPHFRMFKALVESDDNALPVAKELAASDGSIVVTWTELGLGGIRSVRELFVEFAKGNDTIKELSRSGQVFEPNPHKHSQPGNEVYVVESVQPTLFQAWRKQLEKYRNSLNVA